MRARLVTMPVSRLRPRDGWAPSDDRLVADIAESLVRDGQVQPLVVLHAGWIVDGHHRYLAAQRAGIGELMCLVVQPFASADEHEARVIAAKLVREHIDASGRNAMRLKLVALRSGGGGVPEKPNKIPEGTRVPNSGATAGSNFGRAPENTPAEPKRRRGRPTGERTKLIREVAKETGADPEALRHADKRARAKAAKDDAPTASTPVVFDERDQEIPAALVPRWRLYRETIAKIGSLSKQIQAELGKLAADSRPEMWSNAQSAYREAWGRVRAAEPFALCAWCKGKSQPCKTCRGFGFDTKLDQKTTPKELLT